MKLLQFFVAFLAVGILGCAHVLLPNTEIPDTADTRALLVAVGKMRASLESRDVAALIALVSPSFFEDLGDDDPANDYGYKDLKERIMPQSMAAAKEIHVTFDIHDMVVVGDRAHVDIRYRSRAQLELPGGMRWDSHKEFDRIEFVREDGTWKIVKGL